MTDAPTQEEKRFLAMLDVEKPLVFRRLACISKEAANHYLRDQLNLLPKGKKRNVHLQIIDVQSGQKLKNEFIEVLT